MGLVQTKVDIKMDTGAYHIHANLDGFMVVVDEVSQDRAVNNPSSLFTNTLRKLRCRILRLNAARRRGGDCNVPRCPRLQ